MNDTTPAAGTLGIGDDGDFRIHFERELPHPPERVWAWLTEPDKLERWLPGCSIDPQIGGAVRFDFGEEGAATGEVIRVEPYSLIEHTWKWEGVPTSHVAWELAPSAAGTRLTLTHREVLAEPATEFAIGWHVMLDALRLDLAGEPTDAAWAGMDAVAALYA